MRGAILAFAILLAGGTYLSTAMEASGTERLPSQHWSFNGPFGTIDKASAQRGFQVWKEVCTACHSMKLGFYRDLGGIGLTGPEIQAVAASVTVPDIGDDGQPIERPALPSDHFKSPYPNDRAAAAANGGAIPPDHSVIEKAREGHADYIEALLATGYSDPPAGVKVPDGRWYNKWIPGHIIAMPPPLHDNQVTYADGTPASVDQMSRDVTMFLTYMSNPEMEQRKRLGVKAVVFLTLLTGITYGIKRKVWADVH